MRGCSKNDDAGTPMLPALKRPQRWVVPTSFRAVLGIGASDALFRVDATAALTLPAAAVTCSNDVGRSPKLILSSHHRKSLKVEADDLHTSSVELLRDTYGVRTVVPVSARAQVRVQPQPHPRTRCVPHVCF